MAGFDAQGEVADIPQRLAQWQRAGDQRLFKIILSPEHGAELHLPRLTRDLMDRMSTDLAHDLDWVGVAHFNTGHPHTHVALRSRDLRLPRDYVRSEIRQHAAALCTHQLGFADLAGKGNAPDSPMVPRAPRLEIEQQAPPLAPGRRAQHLSR